MRRGAIAAQHFLVTRRPLLNCLMPKEHLPASCPLASSTRPSSPHRAGCTAIFSCQRSRQRLDSDSSDPAELERPSCDSPRRHSATRFAPFTLETGLVGHALKGAPAHATPVRLHAATWTDVPSTRGPLPFQKGHLDKVCPLDNSDVPIRPDRPRRCANRAVPDRAGLDVRDEGTPLCGVRDVERKGQPLLLFS